MAIVGFRHKGLERCFTRETTAEIQSNHAKRLRLILGRLSVAKEPRDMGLPGLPLHPRKGESQGKWSVQIGGNWRITSRFVAPDVSAVNDEDYH